MSSNHYNEPEYCGHKGPKACGDLFKRGNWIGMIANKFGIDESVVEMKLMDRIRKLEQQVKSLGGRP